MDAYVLNHVDVRQLGGGEFVVASQRKHFTVLVHLQAP